MRIKPNCIPWIFCAVPFALARPALAQSQPVLVSEGKAHFFGERDLIAAGDVVSTSVSPSGRYLIATQVSPRTEKFQAVLTPPAPAQPVTFALILYDARRDRATTLWKASGDGAQSAVPVGVSWLSSNETAVVHLLRTKQIPPPGEGSESAVSLLYINVSRQTVRRLDVGGVVNGFPIFDVSPSPTRNEALVTSPAGDAAHELRFLTGTGTLQPPVTVPAAFVRVTGWSADGDRAEIRAVSTNKENRREIVTYVWERKTRTLRRAAAPDKEMRYRADDAATDRERRTTLPVQIRGQGTIVTVPGAKREVYCAVAEGKDGKERYLLATDSEPITVLESGSRMTAIYESGSALYASPIYTVVFADYVTFLRRGVESNAKQISAAMEQWMMDSKVETLPRNFDAIQELVGDGKNRYLKRDTPFRDPKTGDLVFKNVYTGKPDATGNVPRFALQYPFGTLTMYEGEKSGLVWDPVEPPMKP